MSVILWKPSAATVANSQLTQFTAYVNQLFELNLSDYPSLHDWSVQCPEQFWEAIWSFCRIFATEPAKKIMQRGKNMQDTRWFIGAKFNFAQNLLRCRDQQTAIIFTSERGDRETLTYAELFAQVCALAHRLQQLGLQAGDRVAAFLPNSPAAVIAMLASTSLGAIWSACSSDFGVEGLVSRFSQIEPKILFAVDGHYYAGKEFHHLQKIAQLQQALPSIEHTFVAPFISTKPDLSSLTKVSLLTECWQNSDQTPAIEFAQLPFDHPVYILYSSGTTGKPKCMVHGAGGTLLQHMKELILHTDLRAGERTFFYTTCTWMMWHRLITSLAIGACIVLYEGSPVHPKPTQLFDLVDREKITILGVGAKLMESSQNTGLQPKLTHSLNSIRMIETTGSPLLPESFDYVYQSVKTDVQLSSISGGSDIISCFALGNPNLPVYRGELQCRGLGMDVKVFNSQGQPMIEEKGELVCVTPFPSMPIYFWSDPAGEKYHNAYFNQFPNVWTHGDYALETKHGSLIIYGRSDATLKPSGVRIGTAEIYQEVETFPQVRDCLAVGKITPAGEIIILFVVLKPNEQLSETLIKQMKQKIRENTTPLHVPAKIFQAPDLPKTVNAKTMELAVKKIINGATLDNVEVIANPECLDFFKQFAQEL